MSDQITALQIKQAINQAHKIGIISHRNPDGDAAGSVTAMIEVLHYWQKEYLAYCAGEMPANFDFIPHATTIINQEEKFLEFSPDLIIILDSGSLDYAGVTQLLKDLKQKKSSLIVTDQKQNFTLINIDHHITNANYGDLNYVHHTASSTCEIVYGLLQQWQFPINVNIATSLLNGIMTDTGGLTNPATSPTALQVASQLLKYGVNYKKIIEYNERVKKTSLLKLWGVALERLIFDPEKKCVITFLTKNDFANLNVDDDKLEGLSNFLSTINNIDFTLLLIEKGDNLVKGSLRTTKDYIDVASIAKELGGGGHQKAAGFTIEGRLFYNGKQIKIITNN